MPPSGRAGSAGTGVCAAGRGRVDSQATRERLGVNGSGPGVTDLVWALGRPTIGGFTRLVAPLRVYGAERVPQEGGVVLALNHFSWLDPRAFGTFSVRRGESDREAVRMMRRIVADGKALGLFVEGTRQKSGIPGEVKPGAAMVALQEEVAVVPAAVSGTQRWRLGNFQPAFVAWGEPVRFDGLPRNAKGYREASHEIERRIRVLFDFLEDVQVLGRPAVAVPPR